MGLTASRSAAFFVMMLLAAPFLVLALPISQVSAATPVSTAPAQPVLKASAPPLPDVEGCYTDTILPSSAQ